MIPRKRLLLIVILCFAASAPLGAQLNFAADVMVASQYVWRGIGVDPDTSLQPGLGATYAFSDKTSLELYGWWNVALEGSEEHKDTVFEQDFTLSVTHSTSRFDVSVGLIYYMFPKSDVAPGVDEFQTEELFVGMSTTLGKASLSGTFYYDVDAVDGLYADLSLAVPFELNAAWSLETGLHLGFSDGFGPNSAAPDETSFYLDDGLVDGSFSLSLSYAATDHWSLGGSAVYSRRFDDFEDLTGGDEEFLWFAISVGYSP